MGSQLQRQTGILEKANVDLKKANADLAELRKGKWKSKQEYDRLQKEKAQLEGELLEARQQIGELQGSIHKHVVDQFPSIGGLAKMVNLPLKIAETDVGFSPNFDQEQLGRVQSDTKYADP